jgi:hypothetical protein
VADRETSRTLAVLLLVIGGACAYTQPVHLPVSRQSETTLARVQLEDARPSERKRQFVVYGEKRCVVAAGDDFIEPSKLEYLRSLLAERLAPAQPIRIRIERFDTIERCEKTLAKTPRSAPHGELAAAGEGRGRAASGEQPSGDDFTLQLAGSLDGRPFQFRRSFDYGDLDFSGSPGSNARYRARIQQLFAEFVQELRELGIRSQQAPPVEFIDPRSLARSDAGSRWREGR